MGGGWLSGSYGGCGEDLWAGNYGRWKGPVGREVEVDKGLLASMGGGMGDGKAAGQQGGTRKVGRYWLTGRDGAVLNHRTVHELWRAAGNGEESSP